MSLQNKALGTQPSAFSRNRIRMGLPQLGESMIASAPSVNFLLDIIHISSNIEICQRPPKLSPPAKSAERVAKYADMFSAMGTEPRLRIMQLLLSAHPDGLVVGEIQEELDIPTSTLSHHLDKLKNEGLVDVQREGTFLRYTANTEALQELLQFLYAECCTRNQGPQTAGHHPNLQIGVIS